MGDMQRDYIDFADFYAPTVASSSVRLLAALACEHDLEWCHFDIDQDFCRADLVEDDFMCDCQKGVVRCQGRL